MIKNIKLLGSLTFLKIFGGISGLIYSILQVRLFGATALVDSYFIATSAVLLITSLTQSGQLSEVFLPEYLKVKMQHGAENAFKLFSVILNRMLFFIFLGLIFLFLIAPLIINLLGPGLAEEYKNIAIEIFRVSLFLILFTIISSFINTTLNAEQVFGRVEVIGLINSIISVLLLIYFKKEFGIWILVYSIIIGKLVEFLIGIYYLKKIGFRYYLKWNVNYYDLNAFFKTLLTTSGYVLTTQIYTTILNAMASFLPAGSLSIFNYVSQLSNKATSVLLGPISTIFFSKFSSIVNNTRNNIEEYLKKPLLLIYIITFIMFCLVSVSGKEMLLLMWNKNNLSDSNFSIAYLMLGLNFFGFIFYSMANIFRKSVIALGNAKLLYNYWSIVQILSAIYSFIVIYFFGVYGLSSVLIFNMLLTLYVCILASIKSGINFKTLSEFLLNNKNLLFTVIVLFTSILTYFGVEYFRIIGVMNLILKSLIISIVSILTLFFIFRKDLYSLIQDIKR